MTWSFPEIIYTYPTIVYNTYVHNSIIFKNIFLLAVAPLESLKSTGVNGWWGKLTLHFSYSKKTKGKKIPSLKIGINLAWTYI